MKKKLRNKGRNSRNYVSLFGHIKIERRRCIIEGTGNYYPFDDFLGFPSKQLSYKLQGLIGDASTEMDYRESVALLNKLLGFNLEGSHTDRIVTDLGGRVEEYYDQCDALNGKTEDGECLAIGYDGKGVPIVKYERGESTKVGGRLMKGQKRGTKKEATVSVSFSFNPMQRGSEDVLRGLFREKSASPRKNGEDRRISKNVHKRAFLGNQKGAIGYGIEHLVSRNPLKNKKIVALVDCGPGLEEGIIEKIKEQNLENNLDAIIADIVHVSEYIWDASNLILGERYGGREKWVRAMMKDILESKTDKVISDLIANRNKTQLKDYQIVKLDKVIGYLTNHKHKMDYKSYLEKGYPISTGLIEGCCGHLVKDRMEGSGRRWTINGAQNMLDLRAVKKNDDWEDFMDFVQRINKPNLIKIAA